MKKAGLNTAQIVYATFFIKQKTDGTRATAVLEICRRHVLYPDDTGGVSFRYDVRLGKWNEAGSQVTETGLTANGGIGYHMPGIGKSGHKAVAHFIAAENHLCTEEWIPIAVEGSQGWKNLIESCRLSAVATPR